LAGIFLWPQERHSRPLSHALFRLCRDASKIREASARRYAAPFPTFISCEMLTERFSISPILGRFSESERTVQVVASRAKYSRLESFALCLTLLANTRALLLPSDAQNSALPHAEMRKNRRK
jgi:hypothetical protein